MSTTVIVKEQIPQSFHENDMVSYAVAHEVVTELQKKLHELTDKNNQLQTKLDELSKILSDSVMAINRMNDEKQRMLNEITWYKNQLRQIHSMTRL